jgi:uncharacterized membrane protein (UPF0182 family)
VQRRAIAVVIIVIVAGLILLGLTSAFLVDWAWFATMGYVQVFWTMLGAKALLFGAVFMGSTLLLWVNGAVAYQFARRWGQVRRMDVEQELLSLGGCPRINTSSSLNMVCRRSVQISAGFCL